MLTVRAALLMLVVLVGCKAAVASPAAASSSSSLIIPPLDTNTAKKAESHFLDENASAPSGCFAISKRTGRVACIVGEYTPTGSGSGSGSITSERKLTFLTTVADQDVLPDVDVHTLPGSPRLESSSRDTLNAIMREGDFVSIASLSRPEMIVLHAPGRSFGKLSIELQQTKAAHPTPGVAAWDVHVIVHAVGRRIFRNTLSDVECATPTLSVRAIDNGNYILERECRQGDAEDSITVLSAWLCSEDKLSCD
jgi:hypothetical protein